MQKIKYFFARVFHMNYKQMFQVIDKIHKKKKTSKILLFLDIIWCGLVYQAGYMDYDLFAMYDLSAKERKTILTRGKNDHYVKSLNPKEYWHIFDNKDEFNRRFNNYLHRDFFVIDGNNKKAFYEFLKDKKEIIVKPLNESCGKGVEKILLSHTNMDSLYERLFDSKAYLVEEVLEQHKDLSKLHSESINTLRIVTLRSCYGVSSIVAGFIRIGTGDNVVDNFNHGGICCPIDLETGKISGMGIDKKGQVYTEHPNTHVALIGYLLPFFDQVKELVLKASNEVKEMGYIGWDVCIGKNHVALVEGNPFPGHDVYQLPEHRKNNIGLVPIFEEALKRRS